MASTVQRHSSQDTLGENDMSNRDTPEKRNSIPENPDSSTTEGKVERDFENHIDNTAYEAGDATPDVEKGQSQSEKKLPSIFSPQLKKDRRILIKAILRVEILLICVVLGILSIYWGGLASIEPNQRVLTVAVVDFDGQEVGNAFTSAALRARTKAGQMDLPTLGYITQPASMYNNDPAMLQAALLNEKMWVAISVQPYATQVMNYAYQNGNQSYNPADAIHVLYQEARNALVSDELIQPFLDQMLNAFVATFSKQKAQEVSQASSTNLTALQNALNAPIPVSYTKINLAYIISCTLFDRRPLDPTVGEAATQIGLIYLIIVSFFGVMFYSPVHFQFAGKIPTAEYYAYRLFMPASLYFVLSLLYTVLSVIWGIDFNTHYGHAGFVIYWMLVWISMLALGLPLENVQNAFGQPWTSVFLIFWVISNVVTGFFPNEVLSNFYKWGLAWPFFHIVKASSTLIFGTKNWLGLNFGVLLAWAALSYALLPFTVWLEVRKHKENWEKNRRVQRERFFNTEEPKMSEE